MKYKRTETLTSMPLSWLNWLKIFSLIFIVSCATSENKKETPTYSSSTQQTFEEIERARALDYYRQLRQRGNPRRHAPARPSTIKPKPYVQRREQPVATPRPVPQMTAEQKEAIETEIGQNLSYFCMLNRKDSRFSDEAECHAYTQNVLHDCRTRTDENEGRKLVGCVKSNLKL